jgi:hypothetical protein
LVRRPLLRHTWPLVSALFKEDVKEEETTHRRPVALLAPDTPSAQITG